MCPDHCRKISSPCLMRPWAPPLAPPFLTSAGSNSLPPRHKSAERRPPIDVNYHALSSARRFSALRPHWTNREDYVCANVEGGN